MDELANCDVMILELGVVKFAQGFNRGLLRLDRRQSVALNGPVFTLFGNNDETAAFVLAATLEEGAQLPLVDVAR